MGHGLHHRRHQRRQLLGDLLGGNDDNSHVDTPQPNNPEKNEARQDAPKKPKRPLLVNAADDGDTAFGKEPADVDTVTAVVWVTPTGVHDGPVVFVTPTAMVGDPIAASPHPTASRRPAGESIIVAPSSERKKPSSTHKSNNSHNDAAATNTGALSATGTAQAEQPQSVGMSTGGKAGLALGLILIIGVFLAFALYFIKRKQKKNKGMEKLNDDEKFGLAHNGFPPATTTPVVVTTQPDSASARSSRTATNAPRLSLRPQTEFSPDFVSDKPRGGRPDMATTGANGMLAPLVESSNERPSTRGNANDPANPFGNHAATHEHNEKQEYNPMVGNAFAAAKAASAAPSVRSMDYNSNRAPSPQGSEYSEFPNGGPTGAPSVSSMGGAGGPPPPGPDNVHRVQMDFKPSMDDELDIRAGQLIRMLHEYDDGWALCVRLDRTQQGVVPRTCLSKYPVKPRNGPPPPNGPHGRPNGPPHPRGPPMGGPGYQGRPHSPAGRNSPGPYGGPHGGPPRSMSPAGGRGSPNPYGPPRSMSPSGRPRANSNAPYNGQPRSMSPGPFGGPQQSRPRSNSASQASARRMSPPGPSPMNPQAGSSIPVRKPVPGQAL